MTSRSFIFSSDTLSEPLWRIFKSPALLLMLALLLAAELVVRVSLPEGKQPKGVYHSMEFRQQVEQYQQSVPVDMIIIGSSVAAANYPPVALDARLQELGLDGFTSFDSGIRGCNYYCIAEGVARYYLPVYQPARALLVVSPDDLHANNRGVIQRSERFVEAMRKDGISRWAVEKLSSLSYLYGFQAEVKDWLTSGEWLFDSAKLGQRGYVDMGSIPGDRYLGAPDIRVDSVLSQSLSTLVAQLVEGGTQVLLLPVEGDSQARSLLSDESRQAMDTLLSTLALQEGVRLMNNDGATFSDDAYIDTIHLNSLSARENARRVAEQLFASGWLDG